MIGDSPLLRRHELVAFCSSIAPFKNQGQFRANLSVTSQAHTNPGSGPHAIRPVLLHASASDRVSPSPKICEHSFASSKLSSPYRRTLSLRTGSGKTSHIGWCGILCWSCVGRNPGGNRASDGSSGGMVGNFDWYSSSHIPSKLKPNRWILLNQHGR
jgi:hypothetical protein